MMGSLGAGAAVGGGAVALSPASISSTATGAVSQLTSSLSGTVTYSKVSGSGNISVSTSGVVSAAAALGTGTNAFVVRAVNGSGDAVEKGFVLTGVAPAGLTIGPQLIVSYTSVSEKTQPTANLYINNDVRMGHYVGPNGASNLQVVYGNFYIISATSGSAEVPIPNNLTTKYAIELGTTTPFTWGGATSTTFTGGVASIAVSDVLPVTVTADALIHTRKNDLGIDNTSIFMSQSKQGVDLQGYRGAKATQVNGTGAINTASMSAGGSAFPLMLIGTPSSPQASVLFLGDSIANGQGDGNTATTDGYFNQAFNAINGHAVPWHRQACNGSSLYAHQPANSPLSKAVWQYVTDIYIECGTYEISQGNSLSSVQAQFLNIANYARSVVGPYGQKLRVHAVTMVPRVVASTTPDNFTTTAGMSYATGFGPGGVGDQYNSWLKGLVGTVLDSCADIRAVVQNPSDINKWITDGTTQEYGTVDGTHPSPLSHSLIVPVIVSDFTPFLDVTYRVAPQA